MKQDIHTYDDILNKERPVSKKHPPMDRLARAAQFAPFAALTGHKEAIHETSRLTEDRLIMDEQRKVVLDEQLQQIRLHIKEHPLLSITFFEADEKKEGGAYHTITKRIKEIDEYHRNLIFMDKSKQSMDEICDLMIVEEEETL